MRRRYLRSDNGPEFIAKEVQRWLADNQIKTIYIDPGSPWQNGFVESFHARFRDECLNQEQLWTLTEARVVIEDFRCHYNERRPHSKLGYKSPARFAALQALLTPASLHRSWTKPSQPNYKQPSPRTNSLPGSEKRVSSPSIKPTCAPTNFCVAACR